MNGIMPQRALTLPVLWVTMKGQLCRKLVCRVVQEGGGWHVGEESLPAAMLC